MIREYPISNYDDYSSAIARGRDEAIAAAEYPTDREGKMFPPLFFRGITTNRHLLPSLLRPNDSATDLQTGTGGVYSNYHLKSDYRLQNFGARAGHHLSSTPESNLEWYEVMQHYWPMNTRLLDWSDSAISSLLFALEPFLDPLDNIAKSEERRTAAPVVWVLQPQRLNKLVYDQFLVNDGESFYYIEKALYPFIEDDDDRRNLAGQIGNELSRAGAKKTYLDARTGKNPDFSTNMLFNLPIIDTRIRNAGSHLLAMLKSFEINPFHFLLSRYYSDGILARIQDDKLDEILPPLAIVNQYHSDRIQAQRGVFTVFPMYQLEDQAKKLFNNCDIDLRNMDMQPAVEDCLYKLRIVNPFKMAEEMLNIGERLTSLYPELRHYAADLEARKYFV